MTTFRPDVIVLDLAMPGLSGPEVLAALRAEGHDVPVIAISGHPDTAGEGFFAVVPKPFSLSTITRTIAAAIGRRSGPSG